MSTISVAIHEDRILLWRAGADASLAAIERAFERVAQLSSDWETFDLLLDVSEAARPTGAARAAISAGLAALSSRLERVAIATGDDTLLTVAYRFLASETRLDDVSLHQNVGEAGKRLLLARGDHRTATELSRLALSHLVELGGERFALTEQRVRAEPDRATRELLAGLLLLHERTLERDATPGEPDVELASESAPAFASAPESVPESAPESESESAPEFESVLHPAEAPPRAEAQGALAPLRATALESRERTAGSVEDLEELACLVAHDLQEPLRTVATYADLLAQRHGGLLTEEGNTFIDEIVAGVGSMRRLISGLLEYWRAGDRTRPREPVDIGRVVERVIANLRLSIETSGAEIRCDALPIVDGDELQLLQLFQNLISNAIKYRNEDGDGVYVSIAARRTDEGWEIAVSDNGIGIDPDARERVFDVFSRLPSHNRVSGTGLGLAIVRRVVERHGGRIWLESDPGFGTTIYFSLPDRRASADVEPPDDPAGPLKVASAPLAQAIALSQVISRRTLMASPAR